MQGVVTCLIGYLGIFTPLNSASAQNPWEPTPRPDEWWLDLHEQFVRTSQQNASNIEIVFLGSSSIARWNATGESIWNQKYGPLGSVNYGIGGDKIENCLWRIMNGELDGLNPKMVVLYCGSNNIRNNITGEISRGVSTTISEINKRLPNATVLYITFNPRGDLNPVVDIFDRIVTVNQEVIGIHDGKNNTVVFDMFNDLILNWGEINEGFYESDKLHLNLSGYLLWDRLWNSTFFEGLNKFMPS